MRTVILQDHELVIGVDAGGTKSLAWLARRADPDASPLGRGQAGPGNPRSGGFAQALANLDAAIDAAFADAGRPRAAVASACLSIAGAGRSSEQQQVLAWADATNLAERVRITADGEAVLAAGTPDNRGIALISGTGSLAWGRGPEGQSGRAGGWGPLLGDEGSAYAISLAALRAAARAADGRGPQTLLLPVLLERLNAGTPAELIERLHEPAMSRTRIAALADVVFEAAEDPVARQILDTALDELAAMVGVLARRLWPNDDRFALVLAGGVLLNQDRFRLELLHRLGRPAEQASLVSEPVRGAVKLAQQDAPACRQ